MNAFINNFFFGIYPYICIAVFVIGSVVRFDREQYSWKSDSSQMLRTGLLRWGSNLFHIGVLFILFGHFFGLLTPHFVYGAVISAPTKQLIAMTTGGMAGLCAFVGVSMLLIRRLFDERIRINSNPSDILLLVLFWLQLVLGLSSVFVSMGHMDGNLMMSLGEWAQRTLTFRGGAVEQLVALDQGAGWIFKLHMILGMSFFLLFPFTRLVHIWSGLASVFYVLRPYQVVRSKKLRSKKITTPN